MILTLYDAFMIEFHNEEIMEISNLSDMIFGNFHDEEVLSDCGGKNMKETFEKNHKKLLNKERMLTIIDGPQLVFCSKFNYQEIQLEYLFKDFPQNIKNSNIVDLNGVGDAILEEFLSQQMQE